MADFIFACPQCHRDISCDPAWAGQQVQCPLCQAPVTVPSPARQTTRQPQARLAVGRSAPGGGAARSKPVYREMVEAPPKKQNPLVTLGMIVVVVIALGVAGYFAYGWWQARETAKAEAAEAAAQAAAAAALPPEPPPEPTVRELPVIAPVWTLDLDAAKIPESRVNGLIAGTNFVADTARLAFTGSAYLLSLSQGEASAPERELYVFLRPKRGQPLTNQTWAISQEMKGAGVPRVAKRWKRDARRAPTQKNFSSGYVLKLELGEIQDGDIAGKIYAALPDEEQTVVAGVFKATIAIPGMSGPAMTPPMQPPGAPMVEMPAELPPGYRPVPQP